MIGYRKNMYFKWYTKRYREKQYFALFFPITRIAFNTLTYGKNCSQKQNKWSSSQEAI